MIAKRYSGLFEPTFDVQTVLDKVGGATREETKQMLADYQEYLDALLVWKNRPARKSVDDKPTEFRVSYKEPIRKQSRPLLEDEEKTQEYGDKYTRSGVPKSIDTIIRRD